MWCHFLRADYSTAALSSPLPLISKKPSIIAPWFGQATGAPVFFRFPRIRGSGAPIGAPTITPRTKPALLREPDAYGVDIPLKGCRAGRRSTAAILGSIGPVFRDRRGQGEMRRVRKPALQSLIAPAFARRSTDPISHQGSPT